MPDLESSRKFWLLTISYGLLALSGLGLAVVAQDLATRLLGAFQAVGWLVLAVLWWRRVKGRRDDDQP